MKIKLYYCRDLESRSDAGISYFNRKIMHQDREPQSKYITISKPLSLHDREKPRQPSNSRSKKVSYKSAERKYRSQNDTRLQKPGKHQKICLVFGEE